MDNCAQISDIINRAMLLKAEIDSKKAQLAELNKHLAEVAQYKEGKSTGHIYTEHFHVKVAKRKNVKWDQKALNVARAKIGDKDFFGVFGWEFKPKGQALLSNFFETANSEQSELIRSAMTETEGTPSVSFETIEA